VVFIGDTQRGAQEGNILRLQALFSPVLKELEVPFSSYVTEVNRLNDTGMWLEGWKKSLSQNQGSALDIRDFHDAAVIGFEATEKDLAYLSLHGVPWMNVDIHPLRFLDDLYFEIASSFPYDFSRHSASRGLIEVFVQTLQSRYGFEREQGDSSIFAIFGQTPADRSVYFDGDFRSLRDYLDTLDRLAVGYDRILYKPHPYASDPDVDAMIKSRYGAETYTQKDIYKLFASGNIGVACAISSSILTEAPYFGIKEEFLEPKARRFGLPISYRALLDDRSLWEIFLKRSYATEQSLSLSQVVSANFIRRFYMSWGFMTDEALLDRKFSDLADRCEQRVVAQETRQTRNESSIAHLKEAMKQLQSYMEAIEQANRRADRLAAELVERNALLFEKDARLAEEQANQRVDRLTAELAKRDALLSEKNARLAERDVLLSEKDARLAEKDAQIQKWHEQLRLIHASTSWQITRPLRALKFIATGEFGARLRARRQVRLGEVNAVGLREEGARARAKALVKRVARPVLRHLVRVVTRNPGLNRSVRAMLNRMPWVRARLWAILNAPGATIARGEWGQPNPPARVDSLTPRAREIYMTLRAAIDKNKRGEI